MTGKKRISFDIITYIMMILAVIYVVIQSVSGNNNRLYFKILLGIWILAAVVLNDYAEPALNGDFNRMGIGMLRLYLAYAVTDAAAYAFLYIFVINAGMFKEPVHYIFFAAGMTLMLAKSILRRYIRQPEPSASRTDTVHPETVHGNGTAFEGMDTIEEGELQIFRYRER